MSTLTNEELAALAKTDDPLVSRLLDDITSLKKEVSVLSKRIKFLRREYRKNFTSNHFRSWHRGQTYFRSKVIFMLEDLKDRIPDPHKTGLVAAINAVKTCHVDYNKAPVGVYKHEGP